MIILVLLTAVQLSCGAMPMIRNIMDPQIIAFDNAEGVLYDVPDYEDPLVLQHQLSALGAMPFFTLLKAAKNRDNSKLEDVSEKQKIAQSKKTIDEVMSRLEFARAKLEKGNGNIHTDVEKVIQSLKSMEKSFRPEMLQVLDSLQTIMEIGKPMRMPNLKELIPTTEPASYEKAEVLEKPQTFDRQALSIRVITNGKPIFDEKLTAEDQYNSSQSDETSLEEDEKTVEESSKSSESLQLPKENFETTKPPFEYKMKEKKNFDGDDEISSYKAKLTWKAAGLV